MDKTLFHKMYPEKKLLLCNYECKTNEQIIKRTFFNFLM